MVCSNCGANIPEGSTVCANCGAAVTAASAQPVYSQPAQTSGTVSPAKVLTWGILGLAFSELGILGIIFSAIGLKHANRFSLEQGSLFGQAKVGRILAKVGLIVSIVYTALMPFIIIGLIEYIKFFLALFTSYR